MISRKDKTMYSPHRPEDLDSNIGEEVGTGITIVGLLKDEIEIEKKDIPRVTGPVLSLYAGKAGAERFVFSLLPKEDQRMIAIDYNPNLSSNDKRISYLHGDVLQLLPKLDSKKFGVITIFGADGSIKNSEWKIIWREAERLLKTEGYILIYPDDSVFMPNTFKIVSQVLIG